MFVRMPISFGFAAIAGWHTRNYRARLWERCRQGRVWKV